MPRLRASFWMFPLGAALCLWGAGCRKNDAPGASASPVVATVGSATITVADLEAQLNAKPPYLRARYAAPQKLKELLDDSIRLEALSQEAARRGYDKDPEIIRTMKQQMIARMMAKDFEAKETADSVSAADVEKYYASHQSEFNRPDEVRVAAIWTHDRAKAEKAYAEARARAGAAGPDLRAFRDLVNTYSDDEATRAQGGDLGSFGKTSTTVPAPVIEAAFAMQNPGEIAGPVQVGDRYAVLLLLQKRPGIDRPLADVQNDIRQRLFRDSRGKALEAFTADLQSKAKIERHDENLSKVTLAPNDVAPQASRETTAPATRN